MGMLMSIKAFKMTRFLLAVPLLLIAAAASAQSGRPDPGCARDVSRFCRAHMDDGDQIILACLKQNRARLSKTCAKVLTDHGQ
jgi:hypothetical protein